LSIVNAFSSIGIHWAIFFLILINLALIGQIFVSNYLVFVWSNFWAWTI